MIHRQLSSPKPLVDSFLLLLISMFLLVSIIIICGCTSPPLSKQDNISGDDGNLGDGLATAMNVVADGILGEGLSLYENCSETFNTPMCGAVSPTKMRNYPATGCSRTLGEKVSTVYGSFIGEYSSQADCYDFTEAAVGNGMSKGYRGYYVESSAGYRVITYSALENGVGGKTIEAADLLDYEGVERAGGFALTKAESPTTLLKVKGVHRRGVRTNKRYGFWYTVYSDDITLGSTDQGTEVTGAVTLALNRSSAKWTVTFDKALYQIGCCYPISGGVTLSEGTAGGGGTSYPVTITSCGVITWNQAEQKLPPCGGSSNF